MSESESEASPDTGPVRKRLPKYLNEGLIFLLLFFAIQWWVNRDALSGEAPVFTARLLDDQMFTLSQFRGEPAVVHFWATWCPVCKAEQGIIDDLARDRQVVTIAMQSGPDDALLEYLEKEGLSFPVVNDPEGKLAQAYEVRGVPMSFILDENGQIRFAERGYTTGWGLRLRLWWMETFME